MDKHLYRKAFDNFQQNREQHFAPKIKSALKNQYSQFIELYKQGHTAENALMHINSAGIYLILKVIYRDSVHWGSLVYSQLPKAPKKEKRRAPIGFNEEMIALINAYFESDILQYSEGITDTTRDKIRDILILANNEGQSLDWIVEQLTSAKTATLNENRSRLIARTETVTSTNQAGQFAAMKTGLLMKKEWCSSGDSRVRNDHELVNGSTIDIQDYYLVGDSQMLLPGARTQKNGISTPPAEYCNCRCISLNIAQRINGRLVEHDYGLNALSV